MDESVIFVIHIYIYDVYIYICGLGVSVVDLSLSGCVWVVRERVGESG